jgi:hypothetical protein
MKTLTTRTKTVVAMVFPLAAGTCAALALVGTSHAAAASSAAELEGKVAQSTDLPGFWSTECPSIERGAAVWAPNDRRQVTALDAEGFLLGVREPLHSDSGDTAVSFALRFRTAAGLTADLNRRERLASRAGGTTSFGVPQLPSARGYTVRTAHLTTVSVVDALGSTEYGLEVNAVGRADVGALQRTVEAAARRDAARG